MTPEYRQHVAGLQARWFYRYSVKQLMGIVPSVPAKPTEPKATAEIIQLFPKKE